MESRPFEHVMMRARAFVNQKALDEYMIGEKADTVERSTAKPGCKDMG